MSPAKKTTSKKKTTKASSTSRGSQTNTRKSSSKSSARKTAAASGARKSGTKKSAARKKTTRKTTAKKTAARKTTAKKATRKKTAAPKSTTRRSAAGGAATPKPVTRRGPSSPGGAGPARPARRAKLDKRALAGIRKTLEEQREDLLRQQAELQEDSFDSTQSDLSGEVGFDEDFADAGTATFDRERDLSIRNNIQDLIDQIGRAIARIDDGSYGICERCGRPIDAARLKALPHALLCMDCKRREERAR